MCLVGVSVVVVVREPFRPDDPAVGDRDERRADDPVPEAVASPDLLDDRAVRQAGPGHVGDGVVDTGIERLPGPRFDRRDALAVEQESELPVDRGDAVGPGVAGEHRRPGVDREIEVVGDGDDLAEQAFRGEAERRLSLLRGPALEVLELGPLTLEPREVLVGLAERLVPLHGQRLDVGQQLRRAEVDLVRALLGARPVTRHTGDPRARS